MEVARSVTWGASITERRFQRLALTLPVVVPLLLIPVNALLVGVPLWQPLQIAQMIVGFSLVIGGIPYAFLVLAVLRWARNRPTSALRRIAPLLPIRMVGLYTVLHLAVSYRWSEHRFASGSLDGFWIFIVSILILGYGYLGLALLLEAWLERTERLISDPPPSA